MMSLVKQALLYLCVIDFIIISVFSKYSVTASTETSSVVSQKLEEILNVCFRDNLNPLIVIEEIVRQFRHFNDLNHPIPLITIDQNFRPKYYQYYPKLGTFALAANTVHQLKNTLSMLNSSTWWNIDSYFFLVGSDSCDGASAILNAAWENKLLSAIFMCRQGRNDAVMSYTYNPFTNRAPYPWVAAENIKKSNDTWTLYKRRYEKGEDVCENLMYDKLQNMGGYEIKVLMYPADGIRSKLNRYYDMLELKKDIPIIFFEFFQNLFFVWNVSARVSYFRRTEGVIDYADYDLGIGLVKLGTNWTKVQTYPFRQFSLMIISQKRSFLSPVEKITSYYSIDIILLSSVVFGTVIIALMINKRQKFSSAILEMIRLLVAGSIQQPLNNLPIRIYFFGVFWFFMIINATFCGNLVTFLTKPERRNIESLSDLREFKYTIYIYQNMYYSFRTELLPLNKSIRTSRDASGLQEIPKDPKAAYLTLLPWAYGSASKFQLHVSKPFNDYYVSPVIFDRFPFPGSVNEFASLWAESGLQNYWDYHGIYRMKDILTNTEAMETAPRIRLLTMADLSFAFKLLAFGLGCSFVVFIMEIGFNGSHKKKRGKVRPGRKRRSNNKH